MRAVVQHTYGSAGVLDVAEVDLPVPSDDQVVIEVCAASLHAGDYFLTTGLPYLMRLGTGLRRPRKRTPGFDVSGTVTAVGAGVTGLRPGDEVFGEANGSCAEFVATSSKKLQNRPSSLPLAHAATLSVSGIAALRGIRDAGNVKPGDNVLINGAAGGVGTFAIQIARGLGAEVTGVCSAANTDLVQSLGATGTIDYTTEDFTVGGQKYDVILDNVGSHTLAEMRQALKPGGRLIPNSGRSDGRWFGAFGRMMRASAGSLFIKGQGRPYFAPVTQEGLVDMKDLVDAGTVRPSIGATYALEEVPQAMAAIGAGHSAGKVLIKL